jgi:hypothetical protein
VLIRILIIHRGPIRPCLPRLGRAGVQAQPISYAHNLLAFSASFERDAQTIHELYSLKTFQFADAQKIYAAAIRRYGLQEDVLPTTEEHFRQVLSPVFMVKTRLGIGGPQPAEVVRMLQESKATLAADKAWMKETRGGWRVRTKNWTKPSSGCWARQTEKRRLNCQPKQVRCRPQADAGSYISIEKVRQRQ